MTLPVVSIVVPVYNGEKYISDTVKSVLAQTFSGWELWIINDGSTDNTPAILEALTADKRIHLVTQTNAGTATARNNGLTVSRGTYIAFLDADDLWPPDFLERLVKSLEQNPQAQLVFSSWQYIDSFGTILPQTVVPFNGDMECVERDLMWRNAILPSAVLARKQTLIDLGGFDTTFISCEDWDMWIRLKAKGAFIHEPDALMFYRVHPDSKTGNVERIEREQLKLNQKHLGAMEGDVSTWPEDRRRAVGHTYFVSALRYLRLSDTERSLEKLKQAILVWPGLLNQDELYYELGCANQQRGLRGSVHGLDIAKSSAFVQSFLGSQSLTKYWPFACLVLSRLAYVSGNRPMAVRFGLEALKQKSPSRQLEAVIAVIRALLPTFIWNALRMLKAVST